jgi:hypothetical protein
MQPDSSNRMQKYVLALTNGGPTELTVMIEPWGEVHEVRPGEAIEVRVEGPGSNHLEVHYSRDEVAFFGWEGSVVSVWRAGRELY